MANNKVIRPDSKLKVNRAVAIDSLQLSPQEGYLLSRISEGITVKELATISPFDEVTTAVILKRLVEAGAVEVEDYNKDIIQKSVPRKRTITEEQAEEIKANGTVGKGWRYDGFIFNPVELAEDVELDEETKKIILYLYHNLDSLTYYDLLNVLPSATKQEIKDAYYKATLQFHPDVYFGKNLGSFRDKLNKVFKKINEAREVLIDDDKRADYDAKLVKLGILRSSALAGHLSERQKKLKEESEQERRRRMQKRLERNPIFARLKKAREFFDLAIKEKKSGNYVSAYNNAKLAVNYDPRNEMYKRLADELEDIVKKHKLDEMFKKAEEAERKGDPNYITMFEGLAIKHPENAKFQFKYAQVCRDIQDYKDALKFARRAVKVAPENVEYLLFLADMLEHNKLMEDAAKTYQQILELDPDNALAKKRVQELRSYLK